MLKPLMDVQQIAKELDIPLRKAENIFEKIARLHGGPITVIDDGGEQIVRSIFVERAWVEASIGQRAT